MVFQTKSWVRLAKGRWLFWTSSKVLGSRSIDWWRKDGRLTSDQIRGGTLTGSGILLLVLSLFSLYRFRFITSSALLLYASSYWTKKFLIRYSGKRSRLKIQPNLFAHRKRDGPGDGNSPLFWLLLFFDRLNFLNSFFGSSEVGCQILKVGRDNQLGCFSVRYLLPCFKGADC